MNTHTLAERLETTACRTDDKARRVLNVAPDTVAAISADELEKGITLERLDGLNVPALRYSTQITIHGAIPSFNESARPGGYKAIFRNQNGSVGVRYAAIDAEKKRTLARCARVSESGWHTSANSTGFEVTRYFIVRDETQREAQKAATLAALRAFPVSRFYGSCGAFVLAYGVGYGVCANIGAIPVAELWPLCAEVFAVESLAELERREAIAQAAQDEKDRQWRAECAEREAKRGAENAATLARFVAFVATVQGVKLATVPERAGSFVRYSPQVESEGTFAPLVYTVAKRGSRLCYSRSDKPGKWQAVLPKHWQRWQESARKGYVFAVPGAEPSKTHESAAPSVAKDAGAPMSPRQSFALFLGTGKDWRKVPGITYGQASEALGAIQHLRGNKPAALAIVSPMLEGAK